MKVAWDVSHSEFAVRDHYYYSRLLEIAAESGIKMEEIDSINAIKEYDVLVVNYPEEEFTDKEGEKIKNFVKGGGRLIVLAYYENKDNSARASTSISKNFGVKFNEDKVTSSKSEENEYIIVTSRIEKFNHNVEKIVLPCPCSVDSGNYFVYEEDKNLPLFSYVKYGKGIAIFGGSCAFWDNHSIERANNRNFALNLLKGIE